MSGKNKPSNGKSGQPENSLKNEYSEVWNATSKADSIRNYDAPDAAETEDALQEVHIRLNFEDRSGKVTGYIQKYSRYLVAAIALLLFGAALFFTPQSVTAPYGELAQLELRDGTYIELNSGTTVQFNRLYGYTNRTLTLNGEAWFEVNSGNDPFIVNANGTVTEVTGTEFTIRSWSDDPENETYVTVKEGAVQFFAEGFDGDDQNIISVTAGLTSSWNPNRIRPEVPRGADLERMTGWRDRMFIFYEEPLQQIFRDIERRFDLQIDLQKPEVAGEKLTGYYRQVESAESLLDDICTVAGLNYSRTADGFRVY